MASIKFKFRSSSDEGKEGRLFYQVIHTRVVRQITTNYQIYPSEWNKKIGSISSTACFENRTEHLNLIKDKVKWEIRRFDWVQKQLESSHATYSVDELVEEFCIAIKQNRSVMEFMLEQVVRLKELGRFRSSENYRATLNSFKRFRKNEDLSFERINKELMVEYEIYMKGLGLKRNTTSFYFRTLRIVYNKAVEEDLASQNNIFKKVYTGIDKTIKRALPLETIKEIKNLNLDDNIILDFARDLFMMSFYLRGMSFIDMAYLRKKDLKNGYLIYSRKKTGKELSIKWEKNMQELLDKYSTSPTQYLLPIITLEDGTEREQYQRTMAKVNNALKQLGTKLKINHPLTMYVARHSWASIARNKNISLSIISLGMGHDSETTTQIYLDSIQTTLVDNANLKILNDL